MFMNGLRHRIRERGDTIVEVLIATGIISLVLAGAYVTSNKNTVLMQTSQEREQAQRLIEAQIETLRANKGIAISGHCFNGLTETATCGNFTASNSGATYTIQVTGPAGINPTCSAVGCVYTVTAKWSSLGGTKTDDSSVTMYYRLK
jgi:Tfp pilus assembly protein PilV